MDLHKINFWKRLEMFVENVQVNDAMSYEEQEMIIRIAQDQQKLNIPVVVRGGDLQNQSVPCAAVTHTVQTVHFIPNTPTELLGNEARGKAGALEVIEIKTGQILKVNGYGFVFGTDNHNAQPICFNLENVSGESREGALH